MKDPKYSCKNKNNNIIKTIKLEVIINTLKNKIALVYQSITSYQSALIYY